MRLLLGYWRVFKAMKLYWLVVGQKIFDILPPDGHILEGRPILKKNLNRRKLCKIINVPFDIIEPLSL